MEIVKILEDRFHKRILLRNDAKCAAIAEKQIGSIKNYDDAIFLTIGTGIGGAVFLGGKMLKTKQANSFEIGHMVIDKNGKQCGCGRCGCFETLASMKKLKSDIIKRLNLDLQTTGQDIRKLLENESNYELVEDILDNYINDLTIGLKNLIILFKPEVISIGGSFTHYKEILLNKLERSLKDSKEVFVRDNVPKIVMATLKNEAGIIGATII